MKHLAAIGFGYTAQALADHLDRGAWRITGSSRRADAAFGSNVIALLLDDTTGPDEIATGLEGVTHILLSAAPAAGGDPVIERLATVRPCLPDLSWIGYLSTVGVYGDCNGAWVDETTPPKPSSRRGELRLAAENAWLAFGEKQDVAIGIFRLPGIYGPGRSAFDRLKSNTARRIIKEGQVFNRMHVDDIAGALAAAMSSPHGGGRIFNLTDDLPAPPQDVIAYAAQIMGVEPPPEIAFEDADMTSMARSFYGENKRVSNRRMRSELGYEPMYPTYREGLQAIWNKR